MANQRQLRNTDIFVLINIGLFLVMCYVSYYDRFVKYRGGANIHEFFFYAIFLIGAMFLGSRFLRHYSVPTHLLTLAQIGICLHFTGGLVIVEGKRVYDLIFFGVRFDKYVHFINALTGAYALSRMKWFDIFARKGERDLILFVSILGFGGVIEIVEFLVTLTVKNHGVGDYDNNMGDMLANAIGTGVYIIALRIGEARGKEKYRE